MPFSNPPQVITATELATLDGRYQLLPMPTWPKYGADPTGVVDAAPAFVAWAADLASAGQDGLIPAGTYKLNSGFTWQALKHSIRGLGDVTLNCSGMTSGYAITVVGQGVTGSSYSHRAAGHQLSNLRIAGPDTDASTVDCFLFSDSQSLDALTLRNVHTFGFRDVKYFGANEFLLKFYDCNFTHFHRFGANLTTGTNAGENFSFYGCVWASSHNGATGTATAIYTPPTAPFLGAHFYSCSFDYNDVEVDHNAGSLAFYGCHFEDSHTTGSMIYLSYTPGSAHTSLFINGGEMNPAEVTTGTVRDHLIEMRSTAGGGVHVNIVGLVYRSYDRSTWLFRNLSSSTPSLVRTDGVLVDQSVSTNGVVRVAPDTDLLTTDDYASSTPTFIGTAGNYGGRGRQGTVVYSYDNAVVKNATYSVKMVGDGTVVTTSTWEETAVIPGTTLLYTGYYNIPSLTAGSVVMQTRLYSPDKVLSSVLTNATLSAVTSGWVPFAFTIKVPPWASRAGLAWFQNVNLNGTVYVSAAHVWRL